MLKTFAKFLKILNSDAAPGQISLGFAFAMIAGLTPLMSLHNLVVLFCPRPTGQFVVLSPGARAVQRARVRAGSAVSPRRAGGPDGAGA